MISCEKAAQLMDKRGAEGLTFWEKRKVWLHNLHCKVCRIYAKFSLKFDDAVDEVKKNPPSLSEAEKASLKEKVSNN